LTILFADDTNILVSNSNPNDFLNDINIVLECINEWFKANLLSVNFKTTHFIRFTAKSKLIPNLNIIYDNKQTVPIITTKFLGIFIDDTLTSKKHIGCIIPKLSKAY